jgi:hypothetical protein
VVEIIDKNKLMHKPSTDKRAIYMRDYIKNNPDQAEKTRKRAKKWAHDNKEANYKRTREWKLAHPEEARKLSYKSKLKCQYGITPEAYDAQWLKQEGKCPIDPWRPFTNDDGPVVDHDHETGQFRGILHNRCNSALGMFRDSSAACQNAADYLKRFGK